MWQISYTQLSVMAWVVMVLVDRLTNFIHTIECDDMGCYGFSWPCDKFHTHNWVWWHGLWFWLTVWKISWLMILVDRVTNFMAYDFSWPCDKFHGICFWLTQWQISYTQLSVVAWVMFLVDPVTNFMAYDFSWPCDNFMAYDFSWPCDKFHGSWF